MARNNFYTIAMAIIAMMMSANANAQHAGHREMHMHGNGNIEMRGPQGAPHNNAYRGGRDVNYGNPHMSSNRGPAHYDNHAYYNHPAPRNLDRHGYVPGWEGRVRHDNGRWGYYRDNRWYWYDRYFEPTYYFGNPLTHFNSYYYMADGGYIPGWEGRVMYRGGRWGYLRGADWYWYDRYYEPDYYFAHPVAHFHSHHVPVSTAVGAVAGAVVLGTLIGALMH